MSNSTPSLMFSVFLSSWPFFLNLDIDLVYTSVCSLGMGTGTLHQCVSKFYHIGATEPTKAFTSTKLGAH